MVRISLVSALTPLYLYNGVNAGIRDIIIIIDIIIISKNSSPAGCVAVANHVCKDADIYGRTVSKTNSAPTRDNSTLNCLYFSRFGAFALVRFYAAFPTYCGPGSSVSIATGYGFDGPGIESQ
jgi:hypothetical protein